SFAARSPPGPSSSPRSGKRGGTRRNVASPARTSPGSKPKSRPPMIQARRLLTRRAVGQSSDCMRYFLTGSYLSRITAARRATFGTLRRNENRLHRNARRRQDDALLRARRALEKAGQGRRDGEGGRPVLPAADQPRHDGRRPVLDSSHGNRRGAR